jgi:hypothetical protein
MKISKSLKMAMASSANAASQVRLFPTNLQ